jgi:signal transduction histidine kinase
MLGQVKIQTEFREKMADNLEHEMRTPLAGISASLQNLGKELNNPPSHIQEYLDWAIEDTARLESLLSTIRDATNLQQALIHDEKEEFDLNKAIEMWLEHGWQPAFVGITFIYDGPSEVVQFLGDPGRLHQMLDKIVENAVTFHKNNTPILLSLRQPTESQVELSVTNEGPTIPDELRPQIFNSMVSSRIQKDNQPHLGLGLYIAREITRQYGGNIQSESLTNHAGTRFIITLQNQIS